MLAEFGQPPYRARQMAAWLYRRQARSLSDMTDLPSSLRAALAERAVVRSLTPDRRMTSDDGATKLTFCCHDGEVIESVHLPYAERVSGCLSTQVGCPMECAFCATGRLGLKRNLTAGEIVEQYIALQDTFPNRRIGHVVFMGMGEPLLNFEETLKAVRLLVNEVQLSARNLTISTVGVVPGMMRLAEEGIPINLAVSLHAADDDLRQTLVPAARKWKIPEILAAAAEYRRRTGRDVTFEYVLLDGINDTVEHAVALAKLLHDQPGAVNLIPYNPVEGVGGFRTPERRRIEAFKQALRGAGRVVTERQRRGRGAHAACGQLAAGRRVGRPRGRGVIGAE